MKKIELIKADNGGPVVSPYTGSKVTYQMVADEIKKRWGEKEVAKYDPYTNMLTFFRWASLGYRIRKGEHAIRAFTFIDQKDEQGNVIKTFKRTVFLFYYKQVEKVQV